MSFHPTPKGQPPRDREPFDWNNVFREQETVFDARPKFPIHGPPRSLHEGRVGEGENSDRKLSKNVVTDSDSSRRVDPGEDRESGGERPEIPDSARLSQHEISLDEADEHRGYKYQICIECSHAYGADEQYCPFCDE